MYTGITGKSWSISRTTGEICDPTTAMRTAAIAGTGIHAHTVFQRPTIRERLAKAAVATASNKGTTISARKASAKGAIEITTWDCSPSIKAKYTGNSAS